jgi:hypothetical protein
LVLVHSDELSTFTCPICKIIYQKFIQLPCHPSHSICENCFSDYYIKHNINKCCICRQKFVLKNCKKIINNPDWANNPCTDLILYPIPTLIKSEMKYIPLPFYFTKDTYINPCSPNIMTVTNGITSLQYEY